MFTPIESSLGALLIQAATTSYLQLEGKTIGFSSTLYNSVFKPSVHSVSIIAGLFLSSKFVSTVLPTFAPTIIPALSKTVSSFYGSPLNFLAAGLIVGFGTSAGCGCTSGHMLIGLSRLRWRSFVATCTFFMTAVITTMVSGNYNQINTSTTPSYYYDSNFTQVKDNLYPLLALVLGGQLWSYIVLPKIGSWLKEVKHQDQLVRAITGISAGFLFGCGLFIAGMTDPTKVTGFLSFLTPHNFDPSLAMIPIFCILPNIFIWRKTTPQTKAEAIEIVAKDSSNNEEPTTVQKPLFESEYDLNFCDQTDLKFLIGNALFGIGWGLAGVCPGPGILAMSSEIFAATIGRGCLFIGAFLAGSYTEKHINLL